jgi:hypothetical protein
MPTRGKARKIGVRVDSRPVRSPRQNGGVGAQREEHRHVHAHPVGDVDRLVGVVDADVDVHPEDELLTGHEAQRRDEVAIARPGDDPLVLPHREGVRPGGADAEAATGGGGADLVAQRAQLAAGLDGVRARLRRDLEHRLHELRLDLAGLRIAVRGAAVLEQGLDRVDERVALGVDDHHLLLDTDREARAREVVVHRGGGYPQASRDGRCRAGLQIKRTAARCGGYAAAQTR